MSSQTVLTVEDNPITRRVIRIALQAQGYCVEEAQDKLSALRAAAATSPDLVVLDAVLPDCDGLQLLGELRHQARGRELPAVVVTGMASRSDELSAGAITHFLAKPVDPSRLLEIVCAYLQPPTTSGGGRLLLVVADELLRLKLATVLLHNEGYDVETAEGAREGLAKARARPPIAIVADVLMASVDGFSFCAEIRRDLRLAEVPVVLICSSHPEEADRELARRMGADALVARTPSLRQAVAALRESRRSTREAGSPAGAETLAALHRQRLKAQLDLETARGRALQVQFNVQSIALALVKSLADVLRKPFDTPSAIGEALVQCLDAAGLSTGLLYRIESANRYRLHALAGVPIDQRPDAQSCFGHPELLHWILRAARPVALQAGTPGIPTGTSDLLRRLGHSSALGVPFYVLGKSFGVLLLAADTQNLATGTWLEFADSLAAQLGEAMALGQSLSRLAASEVRYRTFMEQANDAILIGGTDRRIQVVNDAALRLLGKERGEMVGRAYEDLVAAEERTDSARQMQTLLADGKVRVERRHFLRADGTRIPVEVSCSLVRVGGESAVIAILHDLTERQRREEALRNGVERIRLLLDSTAEAIYGIDLEGNCTFCNRACAEMLGFARSETLIGRNMHALMHGRRADGSPYPAEECPTHRVLAGGSAVQVDGEVFWRDDGGSFPVEYRCQPIWRGGVLAGAVVTFVDVSERIAGATHLRKLEAELLQAQKMESVGRLAGGVAHDFNNLLTVILGYGNLLLRPLAGQPELRRQVETILQAGYSAAALTRQLLAFSRTQLLVPTALDLNALVAHLEGMLRRLIAEDIEFATDLAADLGCVLADPGQLEQVIVNLAVNARDAMPNGGRLTIATRNCGAPGPRADLEDAPLAAGGGSAAAPSAQPGAAVMEHASCAPAGYVMLSVSDTGTGISEEVMQHLFEPFFTTKEETKGTGLGLAMVYGIVHQSGGRIEVESPPGGGAKFIIYLPRTDQPAEVAPHDSGVTPKGSGTILVVDDHADVRGLACVVLEDLGYSVLTAASSDEALRISDQHVGTIHLLLTDVIMPRVSGLALAEKLSARRQGIRVIFMSGYTDRTVGSAPLPPGVTLLQKPFDPEALAQQVRQALSPRSAPIQLSPSG
jgi:PAS domain S-box-containing protein